jgi:hypothetical protein
MASDWTSNDHALPKELTESRRERALLFPPRRTRKQQRSRTTKGFQVGNGRRLELRDKAVVLLRCWLDEELEECRDGVMLFDEDEAEAMCVRCGLIGGKNSFSCLQLVAKRPVCQACERRRWEHEMQAERQARAALELQRKKARKAMNTFNSLRDSFLRTHSQALLVSGVEIEGLRPAPMRPEGVTPFLSALPRQLPTLRMVFHGTDVRFHNSIFQRGLLIGGTRGIPIRSGCAHGHGVYTGVAPRTSAGFCSGSKQMFVCAQWGPADEIADMVVVRCEKRVVPMFILTFGNFNSKVQNKSSVLDGCLAEP